MAIPYFLTPELSMKLKEPFGNLIQGTPEETMGNLKEMVNKEKPPKIISVGDIVSQNLHKHNINPQLTIIDNISLRTQKIPVEPSVQKTVFVDNPQGTITQESVSAVKEALESNQHTHIVVKGEEDLLTLIAVLYAPENAFVVYGQPYSGIVVVKVSSERKARALEFLNAMKVSKS
jgi:GTP-dependent dephospho-CoA kinase